MAEVTVVCVNEYYDKVADRNRLPDEEFKLDAGVAARLEKRNLVRLEQSKAQVSETKQASPVLQDQALRLDPVQENRYVGYTLAQLQEAAKSYGLRSTGLSKAALIASLLEHEEE